jgi:hypothetical protein
VGAGGRPTKYDPSYCEHMLTWFESGEWATIPTFEKYSVKIGVCTATLRKWKDEHPEFSAAYRQCRSLQCNYLIDGGLGGDFNPGFTKFVMMNTQDWSDRSKEQVQQTVQVTAAFEVVEWDGDDEDQAVQEAAEVLPTKD